MNVTLYLPDAQSIVAATDGFTVPIAGSFATVPPQASVLLDCAPNLVDVLALGATFVVYTVFDNEGAPNPEAMKAVAALTGIEFDFDNEDDVLCGPVLIAST